MHGFCGESDQLLALEVHIAKDMYRQGGRVAPEPNSLGIDLSAPYWYRKAITIQAAMSGLPHWMQAPAIAKTAGRGSGSRVRPGALLLHAWAARELEWQLPLPGVKMGHAQRLALANFSGCSTD